MTIKLHDLRPAPGSKTAKTRVGRGEGSKGKTAGRGTKGTKARKNVPATFEGGQMPIHMRLPKLKGFRNRFRTEYEVVNVGDINKLFPKGGDVGVDELVATGAVRKNVVGQGARRRQADRQGQRHRAQVQRQRTREDHRRRRYPPPSCDAVLAQEPPPRRGLLRSAAGNAARCRAIYTARVDTRGATMIRHCRTIAVGDGRCAGFAVFGCRRVRPRPAQRSSSSSIRSVTPWGFQSAPNDDLPAMGQRVCEMLTSGLTGNPNPVPGRAWRGEQAWRTTV